MRDGLRILALHWDDVCSPWRIVGPLNALGQQGWKVRLASINDRSLATADLSEWDLVVLHRPNRKPHLEVLRRAKSGAVPVVVDVDDLFLPEALPPGAPFSRVWHPLFERWDAEAKVAAGLADKREVDDAPTNRVMDQFHECLRLADLVTVTTPILEQAYRGFNTRIQILPNCYDDSNPLWDIALPSRDTVNIGFAGTDHHADNLQLLVGPLERVLRTHPEARLVEAGGPDLITRLRSRKKQLVHLGTVPFKSFPLLLAQMDLVLAPLSDLPFMQCKSNIRCMTAGLVGLPVVASPVGPYRDYVRHGTNGFLARTPEEWVKFTQMLVSDECLRRKMGSSNRACAERYAISRNWVGWAQTYREVLRSKEFEKQ